ncbi:RNA recognition motif domain-containing protein [Ditylenchus destructor]|uniref:17S U2 SnRNP complex component HTATSF1 n=1 Tax=Ditylenchus destructor TaxID=166010 RepID=A0AAD4MYW6_9BILA|nr:RNA recognition motif domain-containing protein [Ditylenchus destructor]
MTDTSQEPERRFVDGRWLCYDGVNNTFLEYTDGEWKDAKEENSQLKEKWDQAQSTSTAVGTSTLTSASRSTVDGTASGQEVQRCEVNGVQMVWNNATQQWLPEVDVDEDFLAVYNATYGVNYDYDSMPKPEPTKSSNDKVTEKDVPLTKEERRAKKRELEKQPVAWVDIEDDKNTNVYVSGLPSTITEEQFTEFMTKCGIIMKDPRSGKPKIKLYRTETGDPKGDGTCCYVKMESVQLALQILDGWDLDGHKVHVERAKFELKGAFDPSKKKKKLTVAQKKKFFENQQRLFEWKPEKPRNYRPICECTVVLKNMFTLNEIDENAARILDLKEEVQELCARFGTVKKVTVYDTNPEGVVTVTFESVEHSDTAVSMLNGRLVGGRLIEASLWDGKAKFKRQETQEERERRERAWQGFLGSGEQEDEEKEHDSDNGETEFEKQPAEQTTNKT